MAQVYPTKANLLAGKKSLELAEMGYELMDQKRNILVCEMMSLVDSASSVRKEIDEQYKKAYNYLRLANTTLGDCESFAHAVPVESSLSIDYKSIMGVEIPMTDIEESTLQPYFGFHHTNSYLDMAYTAFNEAKRLTVELAQTESSIYRLADSVKKTRKRANALSNIIIPQFKESIKYISDALDEKEREDYSRLKVIKSQKGED